LLDLVVSEFHQHSVSAGIWIPKQSCPLPNAKREASSASLTNLDGLSPFRAQEVGVHEQPVEKDFDSTRGHECCEELTHRKHAVKRMSRFGPETGFEEIFGDVLERDFWTGITSGLPVNRPWSLSTATKSAACRLPRICAFAGRVAMNPY
jgi:hypothetical protein